MRDAFGKYHSKVLAEDTMRTEYDSDLRSCARSTSSKCVITENANSQVQVFSIVHNILVNHFFESCEYLKYQNPDNKNFISMLTCANMNL
jgi:hypothetical protein